MSKSILGALNNKGAPSERFFGEVVSYADDLSSVTVKVVGSNETRTVVMNGDDIKVAEGQSRPNIASLAGRGKMHTDVGGVILVEDAKPENGKWAARWISSAVRKPGEGQVLQGPMRVSPIRKGANDKPYRAADVMEQDKARRVETGGELKAALAAALSDTGSAMVRVAEMHADGNYGIRSFAASAGAGEKSASEALEHALSKNADLAKLVGAIPESGIDGSTTAIEVVPTKRYFFGADAGQASRLDMLFTRESEKGTRYSKGFGESLLVLRSSPDDGYLFAVKAMPKSYKTQFTRGGPFATEGGQAIESKVRAAWQKGRADESAASEGHDADPVEQDFDLDNPPPAVSSGAAPAMG